MADSPFAPIEQPSDPTYLPGQTPPAASQGSIPVTSGFNPTPIIPPVISPASVAVAPASSTAAAPVAARSAPPAALAPDDGRRATNPLNLMLAGAVLACLLLGSGILIGRQSAGGGGGASGSIGEVSVGSGGAIVAAVKNVGPAVLNVDTTFGKLPSNFLPSPGQEGPREGKGTGVVIDTKRGLMLTNAHVVNGAQKIQVTTSKGDKYTGKVLGIDRRSDIAVVQLSDKTLPQARLATFTNTKDLDIGEWTIAIGNPFAQENTVTVGVLSAVGRTLPVPAGESGQSFALTDMLQTDAAINPGNSGGPLCNIRGEVIGINTAIIPYGQGLGFSIPINKAMAVADQLITKGKVEHPYIGVVVKPITEGLQSDMGLPDRKGAFVQGVEPNSPAAKAGIKSGDVIRNLGDKPVTSDADVVASIGAHKVGDELKVDILRNNTVKLQVKLKVGDRQD